MTGDTHPIEQDIRDRGYDTEEHEDRRGMVRAAAFDGEDVRAIVTAMNRSRTRAWRMVDAALTIREEGR